MWSKKSVVCNKDSHSLVMIILCFLQRMRIIGFVDVADMALAIHQWYTLHEFMIFIMLLVLCDLCCVPLTTPVFLVNHPLTPCVWTRTTQSSVYYRLIQIWQTKPKHYTFSPKMATQIGLSNFLDALRCFMTKNKKPFLMLLWLRFVLVSCDIITSHEL